MNDPGLDEPIQNDAKDIENQKVDEEDATVEHKQAFLEPSRWWFASTAFPLIAGTGGPMASAFSICALVVHWRVYIPPRATEADNIDVDDPQWLIAVNAAQLTIALISNLTLLMNMAKRIRFSIAQPITIIGWYMSSFVLIALTACAAGPLQLEPRESYAFSQAYYYAIFAAVLYFLVATLMVCNVYGAYAGHYEKEFQLTISQRTLMLQTILYFVYLLCGAAVYSHVEGWNYLDTVYWADYTLLTVGIGDYSPATHLGRGLLFPFAIGGIIILGLVIGSIRSLVLERGKEKMSARMVEKERRRILGSLESKDRSDLLEPIKYMTPGSPSDDGIKNERQRREKEFHIMRQIQQRAAMKRRWTSLIISGAVWFGLWFAGAAIFTVAEQAQSWSYFGSLYFSYTSLLTIGYGDFAPQSNSGKPFFVFWSLLAVPSLTILISNMGDTIVKGVKDLTLWVGSLTVLPGEGGLRTSLKQSFNKFSGGRLLNSEPGFLGETEHGNGNVGATEGKDNPESARQKARADRAKTEKREAEERGKTTSDRLPESKPHYHHLLIKEIGEVMKHLNSSPPRKYTFDEWAWYLKLIGEDENSALTHRKALRKPKQHGEGIGGAMGRMGERDSGKKEEWSWMGNRSPLMGEREEAEWILERLIGMLENELEDVRRGTEVSRRSGSRPPGEKGDGRSANSSTPREDVRSRDCPDKI
ncbi:potassium channel-like protein [Calycina marina]|uniref:Potassium channel-like protein n=1 Tax=Calycina marina TaxID=1763456 RepID=A0A9P7Z808_9HELO|nr:potassium channel-like protein [Calycina marina]